MRPMGRWRWLCLLLALGALCEALSAAEFSLPPSGNVVGELTGVTVQHDDTLADVARNFHLGYDALLFANPSVDPWLPGEGTRVTLPTMHVLPSAPRRGLVVNVAEMRLYYYPKPTSGRPPAVRVYPISIGRADWSTPLTNARIIAKLTDPTWYPPESIRAEHAADGDELPEKVPPGEGNPLGRYALRLSVPGYLIHGTNKTYGIGMQVTHGCIRMYPSDIEELFRELAVGAPVAIVNQPIKAGWRDGVLYLEIHRGIGGLQLTDQDKRQHAVEGLIQVTQSLPRYRIDWNEVEVVIWEATGIPMPVGGAAPTLD